MTSPRLPKVAGIKPVISPPSQTAPSSAESSPADRTTGSERHRDAEQVTDHDRVTDLSSLHELTALLARTESLDSALHETLRAGATLLGARRGLIALEPGTDPRSAPGGPGVGGGPGARAADAAGAFGRADSSPERTIGLGLGHSDLSQIETVPRASAAYARVLDRENGCTEGAGPAASRTGTAAAARDSTPSASRTRNTSPDGAQHAAADGARNASPDAASPDTRAPDAGARRTGAQSSVAAARSGIACPDIAADQELSPRHREVAARLGYAATYAVPLATDDGTRLGAAVWLYDEPGEPTARQRELLASYLRYAAEHSVRLGELARTRADMATLREELMPSALPRVPGVALAARHRTGPRGGGDWYDALPLPERALGLCVGGVTGGGPAAVAAMGRLRASLRAYAVMEGEDPVAVLSDLELLLRLTEPSCSATALFAYAEPASRKILLAGAGHCPPLIIGPRRIEPVETAVSAPLGMLACWEAPSAEVVLHEGETLLCYTDGLLHRTGDSMDRAFARLRSAAASAPRAAREDPDTLVDHVLRTVLPGQPAEQHDHPEDVVLLAARF
ncbi:PP2C family protein-serine/threonine phosphatase [Streptomyces axinellae]